MKQKAYHARVQGRVSKKFLKIRKITEFSEVIRKETELEKQEGERQHRQRVRSEVAMRRNFRLFCL